MTSLQNHLLLLSGSNNKGEIKMFKKIIVCIMMLSLFLSSCGSKKTAQSVVNPTIETTKESTTQVETTTKERIVETTEETTTEKETIIEETTEEESTDEGTTVNKSTKSEAVEESTTENETETEKEESSESEEETTEIIKDLEYDNRAREKHMSYSVPSKEKNVVDIKEWEYGMTPLEWIYVKPNTQIICNNTPNNSVNFSYKKQASSGSKGCFMPVFIKCNVVGDDYDGRMYSMYDYTKYEPEDMLWSDTETFEALVYKDYQVKELLAKKYEVERVTRNLIKVKDTFVNVVYIDELDEIIDKYFSK